MDDESLSRLAALLSVLGVESRLKIVRILAGCEQLCVNALACRLGITQSAVSQHLKILNMSGLVESQKSGYYVHYSLKLETLNEIRGLLEILENSSDKDSCRKGEKECASRRANARSRRT